MSALLDGYVVKSNNYKLQSMHSGIETCGRWASMRLRLRQIGNKQFASLFTSSKKMTPDEWITALTMVSIGEFKKILSNNSIYER